MLSDTILMKRNEEGTIEAKLFIDISNKWCINKLVVMIFTEHVLDSGAVPDDSTISALDRPVESSLTTGAERDIVRLVCF